jgi:hypothetical protein
MSAGVGRTAETLHDLGQVNQRAGYPRVIGTVSVRVNSQRVLEQRIGIG